MGTETLQSAGPSQIVKLDRALKLAEKWVNNMSKPKEDTAIEVEPEGRKLRLGLGAKATPEIKVGHSNDPVERKLRAKLEDGKARAAKNSEEQHDKHGYNKDDEDSDAEVDSRTKAFSKKRTGPISSPAVQKKKKQI